LQRQGPYADWPTFSASEKETLHEFLHTCSPCRHKLFFWNKEIKAAACFHKKKDRVLVLLEMKTALCREATSAAVCTFMSREA